MKFNDKLFNVEVVKWKHGTGSVVVNVLCRDINEAVIVKEALRKIYPKNLCVESGNEKLETNFIIEIGEVFSHEIKEFVEDDSR